MGGRAETLSPCRSRAANPWQAWSCRSAMPDPQCSGSSAGRRDNRSSPSTRNRRPRVQASRARPGPLNSEQSAPTMLRCSGGRRLRQWLNLRSNGLGYVTALMRRPEIIAVHRPVTAGSPTVSRDALRLTRTIRLLLKRRCTTNWSQAARWNPGVFDRLPSVGQERGSASRRAQCLCYENGPVLAGQMRARDPPESPLRCRREQVIDGGSLALEGGQWPLELTQRPAPVESNRGISSRGAARGFRRFG